MGEEDEKRGKKGGYFFLIIQKKIRGGPPTPPINGLQKQGRENASKNVGGGGRKLIFVRIYSPATVDPHTTNSGLLTRIKAPVVGHSKNTLYVLL